MNKTPVKPLEWVASAKKDLKSMPSDVMDTFGYALHLAQNGGKHVQAKPLKGLLPEKIAQRYRNTQAGPGLDSRQIKAGATTF
jgi:phage-related protein